MSFLADAEGDARDLLRMARLDPDAPHSMRSICVGLTGKPPVIMPMVAGEGTVSEVDGTFRVVVSSRLMPARLRWRLGHELAHVYYLRIGREDDLIETRCDVVGAILVAPRKLVQEARRVRGDRPAAIARDLGVTQAIALLRLGEIGAVGGAALATPRRTVARGEIIWPSQTELRNVIARGAPGTRKVKITDERDRAGLLVQFPVDD